MSEFSWYWEDYDERNSDQPEAPVKKTKRAKLPDLTHCAVCRKPFLPTDLLSNTKCDPCFSGGK